MHLRSYLFHLRARNLSPKTIKATEEYLRLFLHRHDPLTTSKRDIEVYLGESERYAQHRADERAVTAHKSAALLDSLDR